MRSKYETNVKPRFDEIKDWARSGMIEVDMAKQLGISEATFSNYKNRYPELLKLLQETKAVADGKVKNALFERAIGGIRHVRKIFKCKTVVYDPDTGKKIREVEELQSALEEIYIPPETAAICFWLKNRCSSEWRDKQEIEVSGQLNNPLEGLTTEELKKLAKGG